MAASVVFTPSFFGVIFCIAGGVAFVLGILALKAKRLIENIPTSKIRSIAMGLVEIAGEALPKGSAILQSPLSNSPCVYYRYNIEELRSTGKTVQWVPIASGSDHTPFYVRDSTGKVLVDATSAEVDIPVDHTWSATNPATLPASVRSFMQGRHLERTSLLGFGPQRRYHEYFIAPHDTVFVVGTATSDATSKKTTDHTDQIVIKRGTANTFFYISDRSEKDVLASFKWKILGGLGFGVLFIVIGVASMLKYF